MGRAQRNEWRRRRRRRRVVRGFVKLVFWTLVLAGVFVLGVGLGKTVGDGPSGEGSQVTLERDRGQVTATQPTTTVMRTQTVVRRAPAKAAKRG
jgi:hypothetical protein